jgi:hypothetical protein
MREKEASDSDAAHCRSGRGPALCADASLAFACAARASVSGAPGANLLARLLSGLPPGAGYRFFGRDGAGGEHVSL